MYIVISVTKFGAYRAQGRLKMRVYQILAGMIVLLVVMVVPTLGAEVSHQDVSVLEGLANPLHVTKNATMHRIELLRELLGDEDMLNLEGLKLPPVDVTTKLFRAFCIPDREAVRIIALLTE